MSNLIYGMEKEPWCYRSDNPRDSRVFHGNAVLRDSIKKVGSNRRGADSIVIADKGTIIKSGASGSLRVEVFARFYGIVPIRLWI